MPGSTTSLEQRTEQQSSSWPAYEYALRHFAEYDARQNTSSALARHRAAFYAVINTSELAEMILEAVDVPLPLLYPLRAVCQGLRAAVDESTSPLLEARLFRKKSTLNSSALDTHQTDATQYTRWVFDRREKSVFAVSPNDARSFNETIQDSHAGMNFPRYHVVRTCVTNPLVCAVTECHTGMQIHHAHWPDAAFAAADGGKLSRASGQRPSHNYRHGPRARAAAESERPTAAYEGCCEQQQLCLACRLYSLVYCVGLAHFTIELKTQSPMPPASDPRMRMHLAEPPVRHATVRYRPRNGVFVRISIARAAGITYADIWAAIRQHVRKGGHCGGDGDNGNQEIDLREVCVDLDDGCLPTTYGRDPLEGKSGGVQCQSRSTRSPWGWRP